MVGPGQSSQWLLNATIKRQVGSALDLGTGCGIQGLSCASHSDRVVCTDINPRALNIASFNAALNGLGNIEFRAGDLFQPVRGETFDLVTMNPPFAISPETRFQFRDGGMGGDGFVQRLIREAPAYLAENGICQLVAEWAHIRGGDWRARIESWFKGSGCDVCIGSFLPLGFSAVVLNDRNGRELVHVGTLVRQSETQLRLNTPQHAELLWDNGRRCGCRYRYAIPAVRAAPS